MLYNSKMKWKTTLSTKADQIQRKLPEKIRMLTQLLMNDLSEFGFCPGKQWTHFGKLSGNKYHCHLKNGRPTYVACWEIISKSQRKIEVYYVGTHENAPY